MLILPDFCYFCEESVHWCREDAQLLPALRIGTVVDSSIPSNKLTTDCAGPYQFVVAFMRVKVGIVRRLHRILYLNVAAEPWRDDGSDNWVLPSSFKPREPLTLPPVEFDPGLGVLGPMRHEWTRRIEYKRKQWDRYYQALGIAPPQSRDRWGETYDLPQF